MEIELFSRWEQSVHWLLRKDWQFGQGPNLFVLTLYYQHFKVNAAVKIHL